MITVVCLAPSVDRTIVVRKLMLGGTNRPIEARTAAGGKGVNVAMMLTAMGSSVCLATFRHEKGSELLFEAAREADVACRAIDVPGTLRMNIKILDQSSGVVTELNAQSEAVPASAQAAMEEAVLASAKKSEWLVLTGSMPLGYPKDFYARMIRRVKEEAPHCKTVLDAEGEAFALGAAAGPDFVKPNRHELELLCGCELGDDSTLLAGVRRLLELGVGAAIVSMDKDGSMYVDRNCALRAQAVPVPIVTTVGAGDAMVSGYICAYEKGPRQAFAHAVAAAAARISNHPGGAQAFVGSVQIAHMACADSE